MTLADLLPNVQQLSEEEKKELLRLLTSELRSKTSSDVETPQINKNKGLEADVVNTVSDSIDADLVRELLPSQAKKESSAEVSAEDRENAWLKLMSSAGAASSEPCTNTDNESIDADLARVYANEF